MRWLDSKGIRETFKNPDDLRGKVESALRQWRDDHGYTRPAAVNDPRRYLEDLCEQTRYIDIRGLQVGTGKAYRFPITDLYIPLTTAHAGRDRDRMAEEARRASRLEEALDESRLVIVGDPGSGKTTFLRWLVFQLAQSVMLEGAYAREAALPAAGEGWLGRLFRLFAQKPERSTGRKPLPVLVRIAELAEYIRKRSGHTDSTTLESPEWLVHFLAAKSEALNWSLDAAFFKRTLSEGPCVLLLDGLDEAPSVEERTGWRASSRTRHGRTRSAALS